jgi:hypothetical protein
MFSRRWLVKKPLVGIVMPSAALRHQPGVSCLLFWSHFRPPVVLNGPVFRV